MNTAAYVVVIAGAIVAFIATLTGRFTLLAVAGIVVGFVSIAYNLSRVYRNNR